MLFDLLVIFSIGAVGKAQKCSLQVSVLVFRKLGAAIFAAGQDGLYAN
jgi:hypothetical protein